MISEACTFITHQPHTWFLKYLYVTELNKYTIEDKDVLMANMGQKQLIVDLKVSITTLPTILQGTNFSIVKGGSQLVLQYQTGDNNLDVGVMLSMITNAGLWLADIRTQQSSLEEIFIELIREMS